MKMKTCGAMEKVCRVKSANLVCEGEFYERFVISTMMFGAKTLGFKRNERHKLDILEMKRLRNLCGGTKKDGASNLEVRCRFP